MIAMAHPIQYTQLQVAQCESNQKRRPDPLTLRHRSLECSCGRCGGGVAARRAGRESEWKRLYASL